VTSLFFGILFGAVGGVYLALGRRNHDATYLVTGFLLIIFPYVFDNPVIIVLVGAALVAVPIARARGLF
jgi:hypothetical protein